MSSVTPEQFCKLEYKFQPLPDRVPRPPPQYADVTMETIRAQPGFLPGEVLRVRSV